MESRDESSRRDGSCRVERASSTMRSTLRTHWDENGMQENQQCKRMWKASDGTDGRTSEMRSSRESSAAASSAPAEGIGGSGEPGGPCSNVSRRSRRLFCTRAARMSACEARLRGDAFFWSGLRAEQKASHTKWVRVRSGARATAAVLLTELVPPVSFRSCLLCRGGVVVGLLVAARHGHIYEHPAVTPLCLWALGPSRAEIPVRVALLVPRRRRRRERLVFVGWPKVLGRSRDRVRRRMVLDSGRAGRMDGGAVDLGDHSTVGGRRGGDGLLGRRVGCTKTSVASASTEIMIAIERR